VRLPLGGQAEAERGGRRRRVVVDRAISVEDSPARERTSSRHPARKHATIRSVRIMAGIGRGKHRPSLEIGWPGFIDDSAGHSSLK